MKTYSTLGTIYIYCSFILCIVFLLLLVLSTSVSMWFLLLATADAILAIFLGHLADKEGKNKNE